MVRVVNSSAFNLSGASVTAEGVVTVDGELDVTGAMVVGGTLSLPAGIIDNAALASPVVPQTVFLSANNFAVDVTPSAKVTTTITVPAGFTTAVVTVTGRVYAINPNTTGGFGTGGDFLYASARVNTDACNGMPLVVLGSNSSGINVAAFSTVLTGLTGGDTFTISVRASTAYLTWAANTSNAAEVSGMILWFR
jgi:hypothetical protein